MHIALYILPDASSHIHFFQVLLCLVPSFGIHFHFLRDSEVCVCVGGATWFAWSAINTSPASPCVLCCGLVVSMLSASADQKNSRQSLADVLPHENAKKAFHAATQRV